jgi:hypothetical protein
VTKNASKRSFPFVPKSNAFLRPGDFWGFQFAPNKFSAGRVIEMPWQHGLDERRCFLAGLIDWCGPAPPLAADIAGKKVLEQGTMHVRAFTFSKWEIDGNRDIELDGIKPWLFKTAEMTQFVQQGYQKERLGTDTELQTLPVASGWGMTYIVQCAKRHFANKR